MALARISKTFQIKISAEAIRAVGLRPGEWVNQTVEGRRVILVRVENVDDLAGSLGKKGLKHSVKEFKAASQKGMRMAGMAGLKSK